MQQQSRIGLVTHYDIRTGSAGRVKWSPAYKRGKCDAGDQAGSNSHGFTKGYDNRVRERHGHGLGTEIESRVRGQAEGSNISIKPEGVELLVQVFGPHPPREPKSSSCRPRCLVRAARGSVEPLRLRRCGTTPRLRRCGTTPRLRRCGTTPPPPV